MLLVVAAVAAFVVGMALGRWWSLVAIPLIAVLVWQGVELEGNISAWLAFVFSGVLAAAMAVGIGFNRIRTRSR